MSYQKKPQQERNRFGIDHNQDGTRPMPSDLLVLRKLYDMYTIQKIDISCKKNIKRENIHTAYNGLGERIVSLKPVSMKKANFVDFCFSVDVLGKQQSDGCCQLFVRVVLKHLDLIDVLVPIDCIYLHVGMTILFVTLHKYRFSTTFESFTLVHSGITFLCTSQKADFSSTLWFLDITWNAVLDRV